ncbi:MAG TPA: DUF6293 family protein [Candidatus Methylomirabilis sp.]|nr:DUF6293 family protein [Candidatus Methylomirabilis sp.]
MLDKSTSEMSNIQNLYAIAVAGFNPELIIRPLYGSSRGIKKVVLLHTIHEKSMETVSAVKQTAAALGIKTQEIIIKDVFDFFEIYTAIEMLISDNGNPLWINVTSGPGIAIAAMALISAEKGIPLVAYDKELDRTVIVETEELAQYYHIKKRYNKTLNKLFEKDEWSLEELADELNKSVSSISRQITQLKKAKLIYNIKGSGGPNSPYKFSLSSRAHELLSR